MIRQSRNRDKSSLSALLSQRTATPRTAEAVLVERLAAPRDRHALSLAERAAAASTGGVILGEFDCAKGKEFSRDSDASVLGERSHDGAVAFRPRRALLDPTHHHQLHPLPRRKGKILERTC
jgi:hypothetical protein